MKSLLQRTVVAILAAGAAASHIHNHRHFHAKKHAVSQVESRDAAGQVVKYVPQAVDVVYILDGKEVSAKEATAGIHAGDFVVVGETTPTFKPPPPPKPTTSSSADMGAKFIEQSSSAAPKPKPKPSPSPKPQASGGQGLTSNFPDGTIDCTHFPADYGAVPLQWLGFQGWSGIQKVPGYSPLAEAISDIITAIAGEGCTPGAMCSYACPAGYQKTQWPAAQGATKQSIGGLYCNLQGKLQLTRKSSSTLCEPGAGGVTIQNDLSEVVSSCRTDYPGTESMVIPAVAQPGGSVAVCNPDQTTYYQWDGSHTTAQYYVNKKGYTVEESCVWNSSKDPKGAGNWSPVILGLGKAPDGITYIGVFQNLPTSTAPLDFNIEVTGDVNSKCSYINGVWTGGKTGCTTGMRPGGKAVVRFF